MRNAVVVLDFSGLGSQALCRRRKLASARPASIAGRVTSKMKTSLEPLDVTTTIRCEHS